MKIVLIAYQYLKSKMDCGYFKNF